VAPSCFAQQVPDVVFGYSYLVHDIVSNFDMDGNLRTAKSVAVIASLNQFPVLQVLGIPLPLV